MRSNPSDHGRPEGLRYERPREMDDALARVRLGRLGSTILYYPTIGSTNDVAESLAAGARGFDPSTRSGSPEALEGEPSGCEGLVVVADEQTAGRGRRGHAWFSPPGSGLYVSVVLTPGCARAEPARATSLLTLAAGVAIAEAVDMATGLSVDLKWPNDLYVGRRKLAGILAEAQGEVVVEPLRRSVLDTRERNGASASASGGGAPREIRNVILGYGINVGPMAYPPELADRATSLESELGRAIDRHQLFAETLAALSRRYEDLLGGTFDAILDAWRRRAPSALGARVSWTTPSGRQSGITDGIDDHGGLLVRVGERLERIVSGEIVWDL